MVEKRRLRDRGRRVIAEGLDTLGALANSCQGDVGAKRLVGWAEPVALTALVHGARERDRLGSPLPEAGPKDPRAIRRGKRAQCAELRREGRMRFGPPPDGIPGSADARVPQVAQETDRQVHVLRLHPRKSRHAPREIALDLGQVIRPRSRDHERDEGSDHGTPALRLLLTRSSAKNEARAMMSARDPPNK